MEEALDLKDGGGEFGIEISEYGWADVVFRCERPSLSSCAFTCNEVVG